MMVVVGDGGDNVGDNDKYVVGGIVRSWVDVGGGIV